MLLTITLNPSVDISYKLEELNLDTVNRVSDISKTAGGKGLNVARVIQLLGERVSASGFLGGSLGDFIRNEIADQGIEDEFVDIEGETRNCIAVIHENHQTEILESGPEISNKEARKFLKDFESKVRNFDFITVSGSLPKGLDAGFYAQILEIAKENDAKVLLDTKGELLSHTIESESKPFLIKPNEKELADLWGEPLSGERELLSALKSQRFSDVPWVVVTTGATGAYVKHGSTIYKVKVPEVTTVNPVGSGDAVIAGFATGLSRGLKDIELIKFGLSMGVLNAVENKTGNINPENIDWCVNQVQVEMIGG